MKSQLLIVSVALITCVACSCSPSKGKAESEIRAEQVITDKIRFCESTLPVGKSLLIANFGTAELNPLNTEGKGYILSYTSGETAVLIPADGNLSAPKGMYNTGDYLFICDVNKVVVYNLKNTEKAPQVIAFPADDLFLNDLAAKGNTLYVTVTNTGRIYTLDLSNLEALSEIQPMLYTHVIGANGLIIDGNEMYVASYPANGITTPDNVIYRIADIANPLPEKFISEAGQYDGIALSADKKTLYVTNWIPAGVAKIDMNTKAIETLSLENAVVGAADISLANDSLYIPDLPNSKVIVVAQ